MRICAYTYIILYIYIYTEREKSEWRSLTYLIQISQKSSKLLAQIYLPSSAKTKTLFLSSLLLYMYSIQFKVLSDQTDLCHLDIHFSIYIVYLLVSQSQVKFYYYYYYYMAQKNKNVLISFLPACETDRHRTFVPNITPTGWTLRAHFVL